MKLENIKRENISVSFLLSILLHSIIFLSASFIVNLQFDKPVVNSVYLTYLKGEELIKADIDESAENQTDQLKENLQREETSGVYYNFGKSEYDTSDIKQVYKESTLNVSVRYPNGWTYLDQNVKNRLDGVTFWAVQWNGEVPPYVHLEVQDRNIFNPARYKHKLEQNGNTYCYNDPEELEGHISQIIYIRTNSDEDYSIKLIVKGEEAFKSFQPIFFSMVKSLRFGKSFL